MDGLVGPDSMRMEGIRNFFDCERLGITSFEERFGEVGCVEVEVIRAAADLPPLDHKIPCPSPNTIMATVETLPLSWNTSSTNALPTPYHPLSSSSNLPSSS